MAPAHREGVSAHLRHERGGEGAATVPAGQAARPTNDRAGPEDSPREQTAAAEATRAAAATGPAVACFRRRSRGSTECRSAGISTRRAVPGPLTLPMLARMPIRLAFLRMSVISGIWSRNSTATELTAGQSRAGTRAGGASGRENFGFCAQPERRGEILSVST